MTFSVVVTVYNLGSFLDECLGSIESAKNGHEVEVIVVNDGSTDNHTIAELNRLSSKYSDFLFLDKSNGGPASARNYGFAQSRGMYLIPFDADNLMRVDFFICLKEAINAINHDFDVLYFNALFFGNKNLVWPNRSFDLADLTVSNFIDSCACFTRNLFDQLNGFDEVDLVRGFEDWDFWLRAAVCKAKFVFSSDILYDYRVRDGSMLDKAWPNRKEIIDYIFKKPELVELLKIRNYKLMESSSKRKFSLTSRIVSFLRRIFL
jgi:glycosyltransferase involved in cell wall biosynthesis